MTLRPTEYLTTLQGDARGAEIAMDPGELGTSRQTRHSFSRSLIRHAASGNWRVSKRVWDLDPEGVGHAIYHVDMNGPVVELVVFSHVIAGDMRNDRVIAQDWDVTATLVEGTVSNEDLAFLFRHVTKQEDGRADHLSLIWGRANRSQRFFNYVVDCLASGSQPQSDSVSDAAYILRSTAFYGNGKWGLRDFDGIGADHPLGVPYRAQMLAAWLLREFSADLAEHCARSKSDSAIALDRQWRRYLGLGNATGLGMVPYVIRHPQVLDAWVALGELPLAHVLTQAWGSNSHQWARVCALLERARTYFSQKTSFTSDPYPAGPELAEMLNEAIAWAQEYQASGTLAGVAVSEAARALHSLAAQRSIELRQIVDSVLVEIDSSLDDDMEKLLRCTDRTRLEPAMSLGQLRRIMESNYDWVDSFDFGVSAETAKFWFYSRNNQEPRRGIRGKDKGLITEHPVGIAKDVAQLMRDVGLCSPEWSVGEFLSLNPEHWGVVERIQSLAGLEYTEARVNPLADDFLPLDLQRFQLAVYGMENFNPQSTDWLRVTLYAGAPTVEDVHEGIPVDDWLFLPRPEGVK